MLFNGVLYGAASGSYVFTDSDAENYHDRLVLAGENIPAGQPALIDQLFQSLKTGGNMPTETLHLYVGVDTLAGAMTPAMQTMPSPTSNGFTNASVNRLTGLSATGSQYVDSGTLVNDAPQNDVSVGMYIRTASGYPASASAQAVLGGGMADVGTLSLLTRAYLGTGPGLGAVPRVQSSGFDEIQFTIANDTAIAISRTSGSQYNYYFGTTSGTQTRSSQSPVNYKMYFFARADPSGTAQSKATVTAAAAWHSEALDEPTVASALKTYCDGLAAL